MTIALCHLTLRLPENGSLKGKRQVVKSVQQRLHNRFNVAVAEVEHHDVWQLAGIDVCTVARDASRAREVVSDAVSYLERLRLDVEIIEEETELFD